MLIRHSNGYVTAYAHASEILVKRDEPIKRGQVIATPRSIRPQVRFKGEVYVLARDEGGRHTPIFGGYKPQFFFRTTNVTGEVGLAEGVEMVSPCPRGA